MQKPSKDQLVFWLLALAVILLALGVFVVFFEWGLSWLLTVIRYIGVLLFPFIIAWLVAVITRPITHFFVQKLRFPRSLAVLMMMLVLLALLFCMGWIVVAVLSDVVSDLSHYLGDIETYASDLVAFVTNLYQSLELNIESLQEFWPRIQDTLGDWATDGVNAIFSFVKATPGWIFIIFIAIIATFYWCREELRIRDRLVRIFPKKTRPRLIDAYDNISSVLGGYVRAQVLLISITLVICVIGFTVIGADSPVAMGLFAGVMDIIPVLGPGTLIVPWAIWSFITGKIGMGVGLLVIYAVTTITRNIIEPKVVGDRVGLHPLLTLAAIFVGMRVFGIVGLILGPVVMALMMAIIRNNRKYKQTEAVQPVAAETSEKNAEN